MGWFRHFSIGQKFLVSFGLILTLLALSLTALLFYLVRINSYVDRHKRITVPAIVTAADMQRETYELKLALLLHRERRSPESMTETATRLNPHAQEIMRTLDLYKKTHAARTHPVLYGMLADHQRLDLADLEDRALADITASLNELSDNWEKAEPDILMARIGAGLDQLVEGIRRST